MVDGTNHVVKAHTGTTTFETIAKTVGKEVAWFDDSARWLVFMTSKMVFSIVVTDVVKPPISCLKKTREENVRNRFENRNLTSLSIFWL